MGVGSIESSCSCMITEDYYLIQFCKFSRFPMGSEQDSLGL